MWWLLLIVLTGCAQVPLVEGTHLTTLSSAPLTLMVVGDPPEAVHAAITILHRAGHRIVARPQLQPTSASETDALTLGQSLGVDQIIVIHATVTPEVHGSSVNGIGFMATNYHITIIANGIDAAHGDILWSSRAQFPHAIANPSKHLDALMTTALLGLSHRNNH